MAVRSSDSFSDLLPAYAAGSLPAGDAGAVEAHLPGCASCRTALAEWRAIGAATQAVAALSATPSRGLLGRAFARIEGAEARPSWQERWLPAPIRSATAKRTMAAGLAAAAVALTVMFTPVGSFAAGLLDVFQPKQFAVVPVTVDELKSLPSLSDYGEFSQVSHGKPSEAATAAEAAAKAGMSSVLMPATLPGSVTATPSYYVMPGGSATFTFSAAKAEATARAKGKELPPMPANVDGSSVQLSIGAAVVTVYGGPAAGGDRAGSNTASSSDPLDAATANVPQLVVGQAFAPTATSSGASPLELERYLLAQPGISQNLADAIRAIGDPTATWPIPVPAGKVNTHSVTVQGVRGTAFNEASGFGSGVVWLKSGMVYGVAGPLTESEVLTVANSLH